MTSNLEEILKLLQEAAKNRLYFEISPEDALELLEYIQELRVFTSDTKEVQVLNKKYSQ